MTDLKWKIKDILGFEVYDNKSNKLGLLSDVMTTGANDIWVIKSHEEELLIPALKSIVTEVNILRKKIFVTLPEGYESMYGSKIKIDDILEYAGYIVYED
ncbi:MAG: PRC-barrel domain-containing protein [Endomicrobiaceae bacterium]|jgi:16S rRNA processing protein RimM|nr:PRC-barrel domain-containing protein [Endomicrobiaceae bacterium]